MSVELQSGQAPGKEGVGEVTTIVKENKKGLAAGHLKREVFGGKSEREWHVSIEY
jgi:hypothetical protein